MLYRNRSAKINITVLVILIVVVVALGMSLVAARQIRRSILSKMDLEAGLAAFENKDWPVASKRLQEYLGRNPDDVEILKKYAKARLSIQPVEGGSVAGAIAAYRRVLQLDPSDETACDKLAMLYPAIGNFQELAYIARKRLENDPNDREAPLWLADALIRMNKSGEAQEILEELAKELEVLPEQHDEYVRACGLLSSIETNSDLPQAKERALDWLTRAVRYAPESVEALANRARFYRGAAESFAEAVQEQLLTLAREDLAALDTSEETMADQLLALARKDLELADTLGTEDPKIRYFLGAEWMAHDELDRAAAELEAVDRLSQEALREHFLDTNDWTVARFLLASGLVMRRGAVTEGAALADEVLAALKERRHRVQVLPPVVRLFLAGGRVPDARRCLDEYVEALLTQDGTTQSKLTLAYLQAAVARAEDNSYAVIDLLLPVVVSDTSRPELWRLLAEAFSRTDQPRRAVSALIQYLRLRPRDPQMTLQLAKEYLKLRDWNRAFETARLGELDSTDIVLRLLRIEASIYIAAEQQQDLNAAKLQVLSDELVQLRAEHSDRVDIRILQAIIAVYLEQPDTAERELKLAIEECKEPLRAEMQLVRHYYRTKRLPEAISVCQTACERHPEVSEPWLSLSGLHASNGEHDAARSCLSQALETVIGKWETRSVSLRLALLELMHGDRPSGIRLLTEVTEGDEREVRARTLLLGIREVRQDQTTAQKLVTELRQAEGESGLMWRLHQASLWLSSDQWRSKQQDVADLLQYCIDSDPEWSAPVLLLVDMYEKLEESRKVEDVCRQALARNPSATDIADKLVTLLETEGRMSDAEQILQQIEVDPRVASAWHVRTALRAGNFTRAIDELKLRISNDDRDADSRILLARLLYWETGDADQALAYINEAEAITSGSLSLTAVRVSILRAEGHSQEAQGILNEYVADRKDFGAYMMRAAYRAREGELERAEEDYKKLTTFADRGATGYMLLANFYARNERLDDAVAALEEGLNAFPEDLSLKRGLMRALSIRGDAQDRTKALAILALLEERLPQDPELMTIRALQMLENPTRESLKAARETLERVVKLEPTAVAAHLRLIGIAMQQEEYEAARDYAIRATGSNPNDSALLSARARAELALTNYPMAVQLAHLVLQGDANDVDALGVLVEAGLAGEDDTIRERARTLIESAIGRAPMNEPLLLLRAQLMASLEAPQTAIPELEAYCQTEQGSGSLNALVTLADLYRLSGDMDRAQQWIERAEQVDPNSQTAIHARLVSLVAQGQFDELAGISSAYLSAKEQNLSILVKAASILASMESMALKKEGLALFEHAVSLSPISLDAQAGLASTLYQMGNVERAKKVYEEALTLYPNDVRVLNDLAWVLQEHDQRYDAALELVNKGLSLATDSNDVGRLHLLDTRGTILSKMPDRLNEAKADFDALARLSPADSPRQAKAFLQLGRICVKLNDLVQAKQYMEKALEIDQKIDVFTPDERSEITRIVR